MQIENRENNNPKYLFRTAVPQASIEMPEVKNYAYDFGSRITTLFYKKFDNPLYRFIHELIFKDNRNCLIAISGPTGTGKSLLACRIAEMVDATFTPETLKERLVSTPKEFIKIVGAENKLKKGMAIIFDEAGVGMASRRWQSLNNQAVDFILQTFRYRNLITIFTVPFLDFIDIHARKMFHLHIETNYIEDNKNYVKPRKLKIYEVNGHYYTYKYCLEKYEKDGTRTKIRQMAIYRPSREIEERYEELARNIKDNINRSELLKLEQEEQAYNSKEKPYNLKEITKEILKGKWMDMMGEYHGKPCIPLNRIQGEYMDLSITDARKIKASVESKLRKEGML